MRIFLTGATGFIGGRFARAAAGRGDDVVCLVRDLKRADGLRQLGCELVEGDLGSTEALAAGCAGADAVVHAAAIYEIGIPASRRGPMRQANVAGTGNVLGAALEAGVPRALYVSTVAVFGDTGGEVVDETYRHPGRDFTSCYEQTKHEAHQVALGLGERGLPLVIAQPGGVYGPGDHSSLGETLGQFAAGKLPAVPFPDLGLTLVHVDDVVDGLLLCLDRGEPGRAYVLGGEVATMRGLLETAAEVLGRRPPRFALPTVALKALRPVGPLIGRLMGQPPNLAELISSADGVTFWAASERARAELGYSPRGLADGLRDTFAAEGKLR